MLRFFRFNDPYRLLGVLLVLILLALPIFICPMPITLQELKDIVLGESLEGKTMYLHIVDNTPWLASWTAWITHLFFGRSLLLRHVLALLIIFFQASFFSFILIRTRASNENNYFPALVFGILCFFSFDVLSLSHELIAAIFLLLALNNIFKEIEFKVKRDELVLNIGVCLGLASLFVFSYTIFLLGTLLILILFARITLRKSFLLFFGFTFPHLILVCYYYFFDGLPSLGRYLYWSNLSLSSHGLISWRSIFWLSLVILVYFFFSLIMLNREARFTKYQSQLLQVMLLWLVVAALEISITSELTPHSFITFVPSLTYFISHYILLIRRKWIAELMLWMFLIFSISVSTAARLNRINSIDYSRLLCATSKYETFIKNKKVLVAGSDFNIFKNNKPASFFMNWDLAKPIIEQPDYFENVIFVESTLASEQPDIIIDENGLMEKFFDRLPAMKDQYEKSGAIYLRKIRR